MTSGAACVLWRAMRTAPALVRLAVLLALGGCATVEVGKVQPALFPLAVAASAPSLPVRVALVLPPEVREQTHVGPAREVDPIKGIRLPVGAVIEAALQRRLAAAFSGGVQPAALPLPAGAGLDLAVTVSAARLALDSHLNWVVPVPLLLPFPLAQSTDHYATLALDLRITDSTGRVLVETTVDSGRVAFERGLWTRETRLERYQKLLHEAAWQAAEKTAQAALDALQADRLRERAL